MTSTAEEVLLKALQDFQASTVESQLERFSNTTLQAIQKQIFDIQNDQDKSKTIVNFNRYASFLDTFDQFDKACHAANINIPGLSGYVWGSCRAILVMAREDVGVLDCVLESYRGFGRHLPLLESYHDLLTQHADAKIFLAWVYQDILCFHKQMLKLFESNGWRRIFKLKWEDYNDNEYRSLLRTIRDHERFLRALITSIQDQMSRDSHSRINHHIMRSQENYARLDHQLAEIGENFNGTQGRINDLVLSSNHHFVEVSDFIARQEQHRQKQLLEADQKEQDRKDLQYRQVLDWLHSAGVRESQTQLHDRFQSIHKEYPETGRWLLTEDQVDDWMNADTPEFSILWINGKKGAGKSVLASMMVEHLKAKKKDFKTSYFYCRDIDEPLKEPRFLAICKSLLTQMIEKQKSFLPILYQKMVNGRVTLEDESQAKSLIELFCDERMTQFLVIDGLDELDAFQRSRLVECIKTIVKKADSYKPGKIRVLLVSTPLSDLIDLKSEDLVQVYDIKPEQTQKDIEIYVKRQREILKLKYNLTEEDAWKAERMACTHSDGVFLFAFLVMQNLLAQPNARWVRYELSNNSFPRELDDIYSAIVTRLQKTLHPNTWSEAKKIFGWLACAKRPLMWHELQAALDITVVDGVIRFDKNAGRLRMDIRDVCGSLVYVVQGKGLEFVHNTARAFVLTKEKLDEKAIECEMTLLCLKYLCLDWFNPSFEDTERRRVVDTGGYSFQDYAVSMWPAHLAALIEKGLCLFSDPVTGPDFDERVSNTLNQFCSVFVNGLTRPREGAIGEVEQEIAAAKEYCKGFMDRPFYQALVCIWTHIVRHDKYLTKERYLVSIQELREAFNKNRKMIENAVEGADTDEDEEEMKELYGHNPFKCDRTACDFFHDGFDTHKARENHANRHDRPFLCTTPGCSLAPFGFSSDKDCQKHIRTYHFDTLDEACLARPTVLATTKAKFECTYAGCDRRFTRNMNLEAHVNAYHLGVRRFTCSSCEKRFTRNNDKVRHERDIHGRGRVRRER